MNGQCKLNQIVAINGCYIFKRSKLSLRFTEIDAGQHQSSDPIPIQINRYNVLFIHNNKSK